MPRPLTTREKDILKLLIHHGCESNEQIARALLISPKTVKNHFSQMYKKLDVHTKAGAIAKVCREGMIVLPNANTGEAVADAV